MDKRAKDWQVAIEKLRRVLAGPKPGWTAQKLMAPYPRPTLADLGPGHRPRQGGVLILLYPSSGELVLPLTRRTETVEYHKGQISLPGGAREKDEPLQWTALRETQEELGIDPYTMEVVGDLTPLYIPTSDYCVYPFVAFCPVQPAWHPDPAEVAEVLEVPLSLLRDPATVHHEVWETQGLMINVPFYLAGEHKVWGATAMILSELVFIIDNLD